VPSKLALCTSTFSTFIWFRIVLIVPYFINLVNKRPLDALYLNIFKDAANSVQYIDKLVSA